MKRKALNNRDGSTLVVTIAVVATLLVLLGTAVEYTTQISRNADRTRKAAVALEVGDGHLETLFTNWRNINRSSWTVSASYYGGTDTSLAGTNFFFTDTWAPGPSATPLPGMTPSATPPKIALPAPSQFPGAPDYTVDQYRIQAVDPMITLNAGGDAMVEGDSGKKGTGGYVLMNRGVPPPGAYGPNAAYGLNFPYSFYYLAAVDITVPALKGSVTAKVRRVFEKKFELPWSYLMFYVDDLEFQPSSQLILNGPIHTNGNLYIGSNNFVAANPTYTGVNHVPTSGRIGYGGEYVNGYSPHDPRYPGSGFTTPTFAKSDASLALSDCPPSQVSPYLPFGWNLALSTASGSGANNDSYREIIEPPIGYPIPSSSASPDPLINVRYYNQAGIKVLIEPNNNVRIYRPDSSDPLNPSKLVECKASGNATTNDLNIYNLIHPNGAAKALTTNLALYDAREGVNVRIAELDISKITAAVDNPSATKINNISGYNGISGFNGVIYISDMTAPYDSSGNRVLVSSPRARLGSTNGTSGGVEVTTSQRAIRLVNGHALPNTGGWHGGLTVVSNNPVYIKGNYNTGGYAGPGATPSATPPSNVTPTSSPTAGTYVRKPACVVGDAINILSANWSDANSTSTITTGGYASTNPRAAVSTTVNSALVSGNVPTGNGGYSGGGEGFIRMQEDWRTQNFVYYGSIVQLFKSVQGNSIGSASGQFHKNPAGYRIFYDNETLADAAPPGRLIIAAYLQQQRWYQVY